MSVLFPLCFRQTWAYIREGYEAGLRPLSLFLPPGYGLPMQTAAVVLTQHSSAASRLLAMRESYHWEFHFSN